MKCSIRRLKAVTEILIAADGTDLCNIDYHTHINKHVHGRSYLHKLKHLYVAAANVVGFYVWIFWWIYILTSGF